jgi:hypothetical protein
MHLREKNSPARRLVTQGDRKMKSHMDDSVKWVLFLTSLTICLIVAGLATTGV